MTATYLIIELLKNKTIIESILSDTTDDFVQFKPSKKLWSPLEIICHLVDEEKEDFRARIAHIRSYPETPPDPIDPEGWVKERAYADQDYRTKVAEWSKERLV